MSLSITTCDLFELFIAFFLGAIFTIYMESFRSFLYSFVFNYSFNNPIILSNKTKSYSA